MAIWGSVHNFCKHFDLQKCNFSFTDFLNAAFTRKMVLVVVFAADEISFSSVVFFQINRCCRKVPQQKSYFGEL